MSIRTKELRDAVMRAADQLYAAADDLSEREGGFKVTVDRRIENGEPTGEITIRVESVKSPFGLQPYNEIETPNHVAELQRASSVVDAEIQRLREYRRHA